MAISISRRVKQLKPSASLAAKQRVTELEAEGREIFDFCVGEPDFDTPRYIVDAGIKALRSGDTHYTGSAGILPLRKAISNKLCRDNNVSYDLSEIVVANGAKQLIFELFAATLEDGDEVITPAPYWVSYPDIVALNGGVPVIVSCMPETDFKLTPEMLKAAITPKTRWLIINSPSNPTGAVYSHDEWSSIIEVLKHHPNVSVLTDEIYEHIAYDGVKNITPVVVDEVMRDRCVIVNGMSKAYAMTGWRIGYAAGPAHVISAMVKLLGQSTTCACAFAQTAAVAALEGDQKPIAQMLESYAERRIATVAALNEIEGITCAMPQAAFYVFPDIRPLLGSKTPSGTVIATDIDMVNYLLEEASAATMDGTSYGTPGFLRLSFATSMGTITSGLGSIAEAVAKLKPTDNVV
jgi:aspartate aminotransferase